MSTSTLRSASRDLFKMAAAVSSMSVFPAPASYRFAHRRKRLPPSFLPQAVGGDESSSPEERARVSVKELDEQLSNSGPNPSPRLAPPEAEKFVVLNTGKWECRSCGYIYDQSRGEPAFPISPGTEFRQLPEDWRCPTCGAAQSYFNSKSVEVAGFAENQSYGFGTNSLTSGQKSILIYGSLVLFFFLFLSGYFLQ